MFALEGVTDFLSDVDILEKIIFVFRKKKFCQKWDSNPRPQKWTATWTQRLRPLGHPDFLHAEEKCTKKKLSVSRKKNFQKKEFIL